MSATQLATNVLYQLFLDSEIPFGISNLWQIFRLPGQRKGRSNTDGTVSASIYKATIRWTCQWHAEEDRASGEGYLGSAIVFQIERLLDSHVTPQSALLASSALACDVN